MDPTQPSLFESFRREAGFSLLLFFLLILFSMLLGQVIGLGIAEIAGIDLQKLAAETDPSLSLSERNSMRLIALANQLFSFLLPALFWGWMVYRREWPRFFRLHRWPQLEWLGLGSFWLLASFPVIQFIFWLNKTQIPLPRWAVKMEDSANGLIQSFLQMEGTGEYLLSMLVIGVLPALGEELVFRGVLQARLKAAWKRPHLAVWVTAIIFSAIHFQFEGFLPRMLLGAILGYLYLWSSNLWVPIFAHFINNALQVTVAFVANEEFFDLESAQSAAEEPVQTPVLLASLALMGLIGFSLWKRRQPNLDNQKDSI
jgi:membrane protease YdiL (CAAX protease family)